MSVAWICAGSVCGCRIIVVCKCCRGGAERRAAGHGPASGRTVHPPKRARACRPISRRAVSEPPEIQRLFSRALPVPPPGNVGVNSASASSGPAHMQPTAASAVTIGGADVNARPIARPGEVLETVPGSDRHPAQGRGQGQPVFRAASTSITAPISPSARRHAGQHAEPRPRPGLHRPQFLIPELVAAVNTARAPTSPMTATSAGGLRRHRLREPLPKNIARDDHGTRLHARAGGRSTLWAGPLLARSRAQNDGPWDIRTIYRRSTAWCATATARETASR